MAEHVQKLDRIVGQFKEEIEKKLDEEIGACEDLQKSVEILNQVNLGFETS